MNKKKSTSVVNCNTWGKRAAYLKGDVINIYKQSESINMFDVFLLAWMKINGLFTKMTNSLDPESFCIQIASTRIILE